MRRLTAFTLSLLTIVGGHILNRRPDKAFLFFTLFLVSFLLSVFSYPLIVLTGNAELLSKLVDSPLNLQATIVITLLTIAFISAIVSFLDARESVDQSSITASAIFAGGLSLVISSLVIAYVGYFVSFNLRDTESTDRVGDSNDTGDLQPIKPANKHSSSFFFQGNYFWHAVRYGTHWVDDEGLPTLPSGDAYLAGRMTYRGEPASDVTLFGIFNGEFKSGIVTTDKNGLFVFRLPAGEWTLNRINTQNWTSVPESGSVMLIGTANPLLSDGFYNEGPDFSDDGILLTTSSKPNPDPKLAIKIVDTIQLEWPSSTKQTATIDFNQVAWMAVPEAVQYQVQLLHMTRDGSVTTYTPTFWRNTEKTTLALSDIRTASSNSDLPSEYQVRVHAFDKDGYRLASSQSFQPNHSFTLQGDEILSYQDFPRLKENDLAHLDDNEIEQMQYEKRLIDTAEVLAEEEMPAAARNLMRKIKTRHLPLRLEKLEGLILVAEGQCEKARILFEAIKHKQGRNCSPAFFRERCE